MIDFLGQAWVQLLLVLLLPVMVVVLIVRVVQQGNRPVGRGPSQPVYPNRPVYARGCPNCGSRVIQDALYCNKCGMSLSLYYPAPGPVGAPGQPGAVPQPSSSALPVVPQREGQAEHTGR